GISSWTAPAGASRTPHRSCRRRAPPGTLTPPRRVQTYPRPRPKRGRMAETEITFKAFKKIVVDQLGVEDEQVTREARFVEELNAESLDRVELIMAFEEHYGMEISDEEAEKISTVGQAWEFIQERTGTTADAD